MRAFVVVVMSFVFPGFGAAFVRKKRAMLAWFGVTVIVTCAWLVSVWLMPLAFAVRFAAVADGLRRLRRAVRLGMPTDGGTALLAVGLYVVAFVGLRIAVVGTFAAASSSMAPTIAVGDHVLADKLSLHWRSVEHGDVIVFRHPCQPGAYLKRVIALGGQTVEVRCSTVYVDGEPLLEQRVKRESCSYDDRDESTGRWKQQACSEYTETSGARTYHLYYYSDRPERDAHRAMQRNGDAWDFPRLDGAETPPSCPLMRGESTQQPGKLVATRPGAGPCELQLHYVVPAGHVFVLGDSRSNSNDSRYWGSVPVDHIVGRAASIWVTAGRSGLSLSRVGAVE